LQELDPLWRKTAYHAHLASDQGGYLLGELGLKSMQPVAMPFSILTRRMAARLSELEEQDQMRTLACLSGVNLCSNDYLGLSIHPLLRDAVREGVEHCERMGATGSRLLSGHHAIWDELEAAFAAYAGTEAALFFNPASAPIPVFSAQSSVPKTSPFPIN